MHRKIRIRMPIMLIAAVLTVLACGQPDETTRTSTTPVLVKAISVGYGCSSFGCVTTLQVTTGSRAGMMCTLGGKAIDSKTSTFLYLTPDPYKSYTYCSLARP